MMLRPKIICARRVRPSEAEISAELKQVDNNFSFIFLFHRISTRFKQIPFHHLEFPRLRFPWRDSYVLTADWHIAVKCNGSLKRSVYFACNRVYAGKLMNPEPGHDQPQDGLESTAPIYRVGLSQFQVWSGRGLFRTVFQRGRDFSVNANEGTVTAIYDTPAYAIKNRSWSNGRTNRARIMVTSLPVPAMTYRFCHPIHKIRKFC